MNTLNDNNGRFLFGTHLDGAIRLLEPEAGDRLQLIYLTKKDGSQLAFIGPVLQEDELLNVEGIEEGEILEINRPDHGPRTTAQGH
jgi:hypothetical protein